MDPPSLRPCGTGDVARASEALLGPDCGRGRESGGSATGPVDGGGGVAGLAMPVFSLMLAGAGLGWRPAGGM